MKGLTPTERLIVALLQIQPGRTQQEIFEASGSKTLKNVKAALRLLEVAGYITEENGLYRLAEQE